MEIIHQVFSFLFFIVGSISSSSDSNNSNNNKLKNIMNWTNGKYVAFWGEFFRQFLCKKYPNILIGQNEMRGVDLLMFYYLFGKKFHMKGCCKGLDTFERSSVGLAIDSMQTDWLTSSGAVHRPDLYICS